MIYAIASMMTDQEKKVEDMPFLVTTPKNYNVSSNKYLHWSEVRSHVATRQHALKRYQFSSSTYSSSHTLICSRAKPLNQETDIPSLSQPADSDPFKKPIHKPPNTIIPSSRHRYRGFPSARRGHQCHHKNADPFCSLHGALDNSRRRVPKITEIHSILDPFVRLPLNISAEEQNLMQFFLQIGRHQLLGAGVVSAICPGLDIAQAIMQICPSYSLSHIVIGEVFLSRMTQRPLRRLFYSRLSQMYRLIRDLLSDKDASPYQKLWTLMQVSMVERTMKRFELQALHTTAMDDLIESEGGIATWQAKESDDASWARVVSRVYTNHLSRASIPIISTARFAIIRDRFVQTIQDISRWTQLPEEWIFADSSSATKEQNTDDSNLEWLTTYFHLLESHHLSSTLDPALAPDLLAIIMAPILTFTECNLHVTAARTFLALIQTYLRGHTKPSTMDETTFRSLGSVIILYNMSGARFKAFPDPTYRREMKISQAIVEARMVLSMLSTTAPDASAAVVAWLFAILRAVIATKSGSMHNELELLAFDCDQFRVLELGLEESWKRQAKKAAHGRNTTGRHGRIVELN